MTNINLYVVLMYAILYDVSGDCIFFIGLVMIFHTRNKIFVFNFEPLDSAGKLEVNKYD